jgi:autotransporter-associated beta strand protein
VSQIILSFNEALDSIDANAPATYRIVQDTNNDGTYGDTGDTSFSVVATYNPGATSASLNIVGGNLPLGHYQFMIPGPDLHSVSGVQLDGANNGTAGTDYVRTFTVSDPLAVINTNDSGPGSLRAAILYANTLPGTTHTITFAIPSGPQSINLLSPLPATTVAVVALMDATQNVTVHSPVASGVKHYNSLSKIGAGTLTIAGRNSLSGPFAVHGGLLQFNDSAAPQLTSVGVTVDGSATLQLAGVFSALTGGAAGVPTGNSSTAAAGLDVTGNNQAVGGIDGTDNVVVEAGADLTANYIIRNALVIGGTASGFATLTIAASDANGNPLAAAVAVSESGTTSAAASGFATALVDRQAPQAAAAESSNGDTSQGSVAPDIRESAFHSVATSPIPSVTPNYGLVAASPTAPTSVAAARAADSIAAAPKFQILVAADAPRFGFVAGAIAQPAIDPAAIDVALADHGDAATTVDDSLFDLLAQSVADHFGAA